MSDQKPAEPRAPRVTIAPDIALGQYSNFVTIAHNYSEVLLDFGRTLPGRNDIPVVPAIGLIYQPNPNVRYDLMFPRPRASFLLTDDGRRQNWGYIGGGLNGGTWAYQQDSGLNDQLTYRAWQLVLGWESTPMMQPGMPFALGRKFGAEFGYAFGRQFEFEPAVIGVR